jgi:glutaminyl-peptide cyclotransferase
MKRRILLVLLGVFAFGAAGLNVASPALAKGDATDTAPARATVADPIWRYKVVKSYPHDPGAFTEGLFLHGGFLYESTGLEGRSSIRKVKLATGKVLMQHDIPSSYFGEGIVAWKGRLIELTWRSEVGFIYDLATFQPISGFTYPGEGWGLTSDGKHIIMSDGTPQLRILDPTTLDQTGSLTVTDDGHPVTNLNELEWVKGEIFANVWLTNRIARIDPRTGKVTGWIDLSGLLDAAPSGHDQPDVLNGIAYDAKKDRLFVTGKFWPRLYEITLVPETP